MKTQMQIVQEAIERLDKMSREEFVQTLVSSGLADAEPIHHEIFSRTLNVAEIVEVRRIPHAQDVTWIKEESGNALSFAF